MRHFPFPLYALLLVLSLTLLFVAPSITRATTPWYDGCLTLAYGQGEAGEAEHGNDLSCFQNNTPVTALLSGTVSYAGNTSFAFQEVTWKLDIPHFAHGSQYAYVEDLSSIVVRTGQHVSQGQILGYSKTWVEFGLTPDYAYGISGWRWGTNSWFLIQEARNGTLPHSIVVPFLCGVLTVAQAKICAYVAGFRGHQIDVIVAIAQAESSLRTNAIGPLGEVGILQIYLPYHPSVSRACALNALCSFRAAYTISNHGTNFTPWTVYNTRSYLRYL